MVFLTYRPMPPAPWAIPTASECANDDARPQRVMMAPRHDDTRETLATMERVLGKPSPRERAGIARVLLGVRPDA